MIDKASNPLHQALVAMFVFALAMVCAPKPWLSALQAFSGAQLYFLAASLFIIGRQPATYRRLFRGVDWSTTVKVTTSASVLQIGALCVAIMVIEKQLLPTSTNQSLHSVPWIRSIVLAPLSEELFFRGLVLGTLVNWHNRWSRRNLLFVALSALLFMAAHGTVAWGIVLLGVVTGLLYLVSGSLIPPIFFHAIGNASAPLLFSLWPQTYQRLQLLFLP